MGFVRHPKQNKPQRIASKRIGLNRKVNDNSIDSSLKPIERIDLFKEGAEGLIIVNITQRELRYASSIFRDLSSHDISLIDLI